jgi:uncharacterized small protein (DUF1192 family)
MRKEMPNPLAEIPIDKMNLEQLDMRIQELDAEIEKLKSQDKESEETMDASYATEGERITAKLKLRFYETQLLTKINEKAQCVMQKQALLQGKPKA